MGLSRCELHVTGHINFLCSVTQSRRGLSDLWVYRKSKRLKILCPHFLPLATNISPAPNISYSSDDSLIEAAVNTRPVCERQSYGNEKEPSRRAVGSPFKGFPPSDGEVNSDLKLATGLRPYAILATNPTSSGIYHKMYGTINTTEYNAVHYELLTLSFTMTTLDQAHTSLHQTHITRYAALQNS
jgi:hypothetical protein